MSKLKQPFTIRDFISIFETFDIDKCEQLIGMDKNFRSIIEDQHEVIFALSKCLTKQQKDSCYISKNEVEQIAKSTGYQIDNIKKVMRIYNGMKKIIYKMLANHPNPPKSPSPAGAALVVEPANFIVADGNKCKG